MSNSSKRHKKGLICTAIFHGCLLILLFVFGFSTPLPLPGEEGILINFGENKPGQGSISLQKSIPPPQKVEKIVEKKTKEETLTQDFEESVALPEKKKSKKKDPEKKKQDKPKPEEKEEVKKEPQRQVNKNALFPGRKQTEGQVQKGKSTGHSNSGTANQGDPNSTSNKKGTGLGAEGISFSLSGRQPLKLPKPEYYKQVEGKVVVEVTVDRTGKVTQAVPGVKGSTTLDEYLLKVAKAAALKAHFDTKKSAPAYQKGTITYNFVLQ